jgi:hypothetical protein
VFYCSDYPNLFHLDPVSTAIWPVSFDLIMFIIIYRSMTYDSSIRKNLKCLWFKCFIFCLIVSQAVSISTSASKFSESVNIFYILASYSS